MKPMGQFDMTSLIENGDRFQRERRESMQDTSSAHEEESFPTGGARQ